MAKFNYRKYLKKHPDAILYNFPLEELDSRERRILTLRSRGLTYTQISKYYPVTRQRIEQIMDGIVRKYLEYRDMNAEVKVK